MRASIKPLIIDAPRRIYDEKTHSFEWSRVEYEVIDVPPGPTTTSAASFIEVTVPARNVGAGLALLEDVRLRVRGRRIASRTTQTVLPAGEAISLSFWIDENDEENRDYKALADAEADLEDLFVDVVYTDLAGAQKTITRFWLRHTGLRDLAKQRYYVYRATPSAADDEGHTPNQ